jgi:hypothetical protein
MDNVSIVAIGVAVISLVFGERIKDTAAQVYDSIKFKLGSGQTRIVEETLGRVLGKLHNFNAAITGELNHIKGQNQEILQSAMRDNVLIHNRLNTIIEGCTKGGADKAQQHGALIQELAFLRVQVDALAARPTGYEDVLYVKAGFEELNNRLSQPPVEDINQTYLAALASLAKADESILSRQAKVEDLLVQLVAKLNQLTN